MMDEEKDRIRRLTDDAEKMLPTYSGKAERLTPDEERQDYQVVASVPDGLQRHLKEEVAKFGKRRAILSFADWEIKNRV